MVLSKFWNWDWRFSWKLKTDQHWYTEMDEITKFIAHNVCVMRQGLVPLGKPKYIFMLKWMKSQSLSHTICVMSQGLVPLGKPTYIFTFKWMKSQSLAHTMCVMSQRPSSPRKAHIYSYIEMDEITKFISRNVCHEPKA